MRGEETVSFDEHRLLEGEEPEYIVSMSAACQDRAQAERIFGKLSATALDVSHDSISQTVSKFPYNDRDEEPSGEYFDEYTLMKVRRALKDAEISDFRVDDAIRNLQNAGILFRERR